MQLTHRQWTIPQVTFSVKSCEGLVKHLTQYISSHLKLLTVATLATNSGTAATHLAGVFKPYWFGHWPHVTVTICLAVATSDYSLAY